MAGPIIAEVYWDRFAVYGGGAGCFRARLRDNHGIHDCAISQAGVLQRLVITAATHGWSADPADYEAVRIDVPPERRA